MTQFEVDFSESLKQVAEFQLRISNLGQGLDALEAKGKKSKSASARVLREMNAEYDKLEKILANAGTDAEALGKTMQNVRNQVANLMSGVAANNLKATAQAKALNGEFGAMGRLLNDTASKNTYSNWLMRTAQLSNKLRGENGYLQASIASLSTAEGKLNAELKATLATKQRLTTADTRMRMLTVEQSAALSTLMSEQGRLNAVNQVTLAAKRAEITETARQTTQTAALERQLKSLSGGQAEQVARLQAQVSARKAAIREEMTEKKAVNELEAALRREEAQLVRLRAQSTLMAGAHGKQVAAIKMQIAEQERLNRINAMSNAQLLGLGGSLNRVNVAQQAGAQTAAAFRAAITGLHASFGMYTSATVVAASATYAFTAGVRDSILTGAEFYDTMQRTRAIMSTGGPQWMGDSGESAKAMEAQVRALGMTTVYTASEVGEGLQQLGMAGFSASEAITALPASLQLANLANVSMARSADIATNVLMTFGMQAKDLGGVVDLMATAVNNSNTDIEQLANALTYAGPAAQTAGYSLQETVAAIEALANSGFKASRAGTGLRRLMVSLLNPTKKGQEVLDRFSISTTDAEGNARGLVDVIGQLNAAFDGLTGPEQLAAVKDLVGVYATPQVAALIAQYSNLQKFAGQNQDVSGAASRMEAIINDSLAKDWKQMLSSIEEVQLEAFSRLDMRLRELTASTSTWILELLEPIGQLDTGESFSKLDVYLVNAEKSAKAIGLAIGGMVAYKFASGNMFRGLAEDAGKASERLSVLAERFAATSTSMTTLTPNATAATTAMRAQHAAALATSGGLTTLAGGASAAAGALGRLASVAAVAMRALGWVGLIYGIGSALVEVFGSSAQDKLEENAGKVDALKESYAALRAEIDGVGIAAQRRALERQQESDSQGTKAIQDRLGFMRRAQDSSVVAGLGIDPVIQTEIKSLEDMLDTYSARMGETEKTIQSLGSNTADYDDTVLAHARNLEEVTRITKDLANAQALLNATMAAGPESGLYLGGSAAQVSALEAQLQAARNRLAPSQQAVQTVVAQARPASETFAMLDKTAGEEAAAEAYKKTTSNAQKLLDIESEIAKARQARADLIEKDNKALAEGNRNARPGLADIENAQKRIVSLEADRLEAQEKVNDETAAYDLARTRANAKNLTDAENLANAKARDLELTRLIAEAEKPPEGKAKDLQAITKLYSEQANVREQINSISSKGGKADNKADKDREQALNTALRQYEQLAKRYDPISAAQIEMAKSTEAMNLLMTSGKITAEQQAKALQELRKAHHETTLEQDKNYQSLLKLRTAYTDSKFNTAAKEMAELNRLYKEGALGLQEYTQLTLRMKKAQKKEAIAGLPEVNFSVGDASSSPFTDWATGEIGRAKDMSAFQTRFGDLSESTQMMMEDINRRQTAAEAAKAAERLSEEQHQAAMLDIQKRYDGERMAAQEAYATQYTEVNNKMNAYAEASGKLALASAMGSAADLLGQFASVAEGASAAQKAAFVAQKALAVAQIIVYTELAAAQAMAIPGDVTKVVGLSLASFIRATGYASAGLVAAQAIGSVASGGKGTQMYDTGGFIPYNRVGIVGEYGPELVSGPAHVTGRGASASKLGGGSKGGDVHLTIAPVVQMQAPQGSGGGSRQDAQDVANLVSSLVTKQLQTEMRTNGILDEWARSRKA